MTTTPAGLADLRAAALAATPGPWTLTVHTCSDIEHPENFEAYEGDDWTIAHGGKSVVAMEDGIRKADDVRFIAAANPAAILALLDHIDQVRASTIEECAKVCDRIFETQCYHPMEEWIIEKCAADIRALALPAAPNEEKG